MKTNMKQSIIALMMAGMMAIPLAMATEDPENVKNASAISKNATTLTVSWDEAKDSEGNPVDHYRIYYGSKSVQGGEAENYESEVDTPDNQTTYDLRGLVTNTTYYLSVTALDSANIESLEYSIETSGAPGAEAMEAGDTVAPTILNVIASDSTHVLVGFSEEVVLPELLAEAAFTITEQLNPSNALQVISAKKYEDDPQNKTIILETAEQTKGLNYIVTVSVAITDLAGNPLVSGSTDSGFFLGSNKVATMKEEVQESEEADTKQEDVPEEITVEELDDAVEDAELNERAQDLLEQTPNQEFLEADVTPPEDIANFVLSFKEQFEKFVIMMNWTASLNTAKDLVDQILYSSVDRGVTYDSGNSLGGLATTHQVPNLEGGKEYTFKLTTKDSSGNESVGAIKSIRLPQTGFGAGILVLASAFGANRVLRRKRKKDVF